MGRRWPFCEQRSVVEASPAFVIVGVLDLATIALAGV